MIVILMFFWMGADLFNSKVLRSFAWGLTAENAAVEAKDAKLFSRNPESLRELSRKASETQNWHADWTD